VRGEIGISNCAGGGNTRLEVANLEASASKPRASSALFCVVFRLLAPVSHTKREREREKKSLKKQLSKATGSVHTGPYRH